MMIALLPRNSRVTSQRTQSYFPTFQSYFSGNLSTRLAVLKMYAGTDCTKEFYALHTTAVLEKYHDRLVVGRYLGESGGKPTETSLKRPEKTAEDLVSHVPYGEIPLLRENWIRMPWWKDSHREFLFALRSALKPFVRDSYEIERSGEFISSELQQVGMRINFRCTLYITIHLYGLP